jgi:hypothetical protein
MNEVSTAKRIQVIAALSVEQLGIDLPEGKKDTLRNTKQ